jgi:hypothetical protein
MSQTPSFNRRVYGKIQDYFCNINGAYSAVLFTLRKVISVQQKVIVEGDVEFGKKKLCMV